MAGQIDWTASSPYGRFSRFGPYYAMFPTQFVIETLKAHGKAPGLVLDPFCGRGTVPFVASALGLPSVGIDINEVAWVFAKAKTDPPGEVDSVLARIADVEAEAAHEDETPENEFQQWCWDPRVLSFLRAARRMLDWKTDRTDRMLMASILVVLHAKLGEGLSNQIRQAKSMAPDYSVRWWKGKGVKAPKVDPGALMRDKIKWRYAKGAPPLKAKSSIFLGDSSSVLNSEIDFAPAKLIVTSPPYAGITDYRYDNWIRLWMLGGPCLPASVVDGGLRYTNHEKFSEMIDTVFEAAKRRSSPDVTVFVRTDARPFTLEATLGVIERLWPEHRLAFHHGVPARSQTELYAPKTKIVGEVDILLTRRASGKGVLKSVRNGKCIMDQVAASLAA